MAKEAPDVERVGRRRKLRTAADVAKRVADFKDTKVYEEGVMPLNPGFFKLQRMRAK